MEKLRFELEPDQHAFHYIYDPASFTIPGASEHLRFGLTALTDALPEEVRGRVQRKEFPFHRRKKEPKGYPVLGLRDTTNLLATRRVKVGVGPGLHWEGLELQLRKAVVMNEARDIVFRDQRLRIEATTYKMGDLERFLSGRTPYPFGFTAETLVINPVRVVIL